MARSDCDIYEKKMIEFLKQFLQFQTAPKMRTIEVPDENLMGFQIEYIYPGRLLVCQESAK
jgi:hypothetical protein